MAERLLDYDPLTGVKTFFSYDDATDTTTLRTEQDVEGILKKNKALQNEPINKKGEFWRAASIPLAVIEKWLREDGIDVFNPNHKEAVRRKLNSSEYRHLRTGLHKI